MRLATVFDPDSHEPRAVFELPGGRRVDLRELFCAESDGLMDDELHDALHDELPLYFTDLSKTVEYLDDVIDAARQWARERAEVAEQSGGAELDAREVSPSAVDRMPFLPPVPVVRAFREFDAFETHATAWRGAHGISMPKTWFDAPALGLALASSLVGHGKAVHAPAGSEELDFGLQLAAVVGRGGKNVPAADAWRHVAGFTIVDAFVARDIERAEISLGLGRSKSRDFATAVGPYLVSLDALRDRIDSDGRLHLTMRALLNGEEASRADASTMHFPWPKLIEQAVRDEELCPGDLISSGTVGGGCMLDLNTGTWLKPGDRVELEIERLGTLRTPIIERAASDAVGLGGSTSTRAPLV